MNELIKLNGVSRTFGHQQVLKDINLSLPKRGFIGIVGASGSGKSTLLNILSGLDVSYEGKANIGKHCLKDMDEKARLEFRLRNIGYVFQDFRLLEQENVMANILFPCDALSSTDHFIKRRRVKDLLSFVSLKGRELDKVSLLSGGEKQRVAICRALINDPPIILADEPSGALDEKNGEAVFKLLKSLSKRKLVIVVSHDGPLTSSFADLIIKIEDGHIEEKDNEIEPASFELKTVSPLRNKRKSRLSLSFLLGHAWRILRSKKIRSAISESAVAIGLLGLGLSIYVSSSISNEMKNAFSAIVETNQIHFSPPNPATSPIDHIYSAPIEKLDEIKSIYEDEIIDYGTSYPVNFEQYYIDQNEFYVTRGIQKIVLPSFSIRNINDYLWLDEFPELSLFPSRPSLMEKDQVVLGLPYSSMFNLCYGLQILRNYEALGNYIYQHGLTGIFSLANYSWSYEDEQMLNIVAITASSSPCFYHLDHHWTTYMFEETMRFPSSDHQDNSLPWIMNKVHYVCPSIDRRDFLSLVRKDERFSDLVFISDSYDYNQSFCEIGGVCPSNRLYVYIADKYSVPFSSFYEVSSFLGDKGKVLPLTTSSYVSYPSSLLSGTPFRFFLSPSEDSIDDVIDAYSRVKEEDSQLDFDIPSDCYDANYIKASAGGLKIYPSVHKITEGRYPSGIEEIAITKGLYERIGKQSELIVAAQINETSSFGYINRQFVRKKLKVVGITDSDRIGIEVDDDWTIDFFLLGLGMSGFTLEPTGGLVFLKDGVDKDAVMSSLSKQFPHFRFSDPSEEVSSSIDSTIGYVSAILSGFSFIALSISVLLFIVTMIVFVSENKKEASLLYVVGISRADIAKCYAAQSGLFIFLAYIESALGMLGLEFVVHSYIGGSFSSSSPFIVSWPPLIAMTCFAFLSFLFTFLAFGIFGAKAKY